MLIDEMISKEDLKFYTPVIDKSQLTLEEKDELLFALMEFLNLRVVRAQYDPSFTILTLKR